MSALPGDGSDTPISPRGSAVEDLLTSNRAVTPRRSGARSNRVDSGDAAMRGLSSDSSRSAPVRAPTRRCRVRVAPRRRSASRYGRATSSCRSTTGADRTETPLLVDRRAHQRRGTRAHWQRHPRPPHHNPVVLAKALATLDWCRTGASPASPVATRAGGFAALGVSFRDRGAITDDSLRRSALGRRSCPPGPFRGVLDVCFSRKRGSSRTRPSSSAAPAPALRRDSFGSCGTASGRRSSRPPASSGSSASHRASRAHGRSMSRSTFSRSRRS